EVVEALVGGRAVFLQGCGGDQMPHDALTGDTGVAERIGRRLGVDAASAALGIDTRPGRHEFDRVVESGAPLGLWRKVFAEDTPTPVESLNARISLPVLRTRPVEELRRIEAAARAASLAVDRSTAT